MNVMPARTRRLRCEGETMTTLHVVVETSFEYNDEVYHSVEGEAGAPVIGYKNKKKAETECKRRTIEWLRSCSNLWEYGYGADEVVSDQDKLQKLLSLDMKIEKCAECGRKYGEDEKFCAECGEKRGKNVDLDELDLSTYSDEILEQVATLLQFTPYRVVSIEQGD